jgi:DUF1009 family protein
MPGPNRPAPVDEPTSRQTTLGDAASLLLAARRARPIALLAGSGRFPMVFAEKAHSLGLPLVGLGLRCEASPELARYCRHFYWTGVAKLGRMVRLCKRHGVERIVMAGKVHKATFLHRPWKMLTLLPDWRTIKFWYFRWRRDNRDDTLLLGLIADFARDGLHFESALNLCPELLVRPGVHSKRRPTARELADIQFGWDVAKVLGDLDVGQSVAVKEKSVLAVEAVEGTDRAILRAGELCRAGGFVVVKVAKPRQDMRFDVPTIGCNTIETLHRAGGRVLAIEADKTIVLDREQVVALADRHGITLVALDAQAGVAAA